MKIFKLVKKNQTYLIKLDDDMWEVANKYKWSVVNHSQYGAYFRLYIDGSYVYLHRMVMDTKNEDMVDHIDGDTLNNQRVNLRTVTRQQNAFNSILKRKNTTGHKNIHQRNGRYHVLLESGDVAYRAGLFDTFDEALDAYQKLASVVHGEYARLT